MNELRSSGALPASRVLFALATCFALGATGVEAQAAPDTLTLAVGGEARLFAPGTPEGLHVSQGFRSHRLIGGIAGFVAGAGATYLILNSGGSTAPCDRSANQDALNAGECLGLYALGGLAGGGLGILIGGAFRSERFEALPVGRVRMGWLPGRPPSLGLVLRI